MATHYSKHNFLLFPLYLLLSISSCTSIKETKRPENWQNISFSHDYPNENSCTFHNDPIAWTRGQTISDVGQTFSTLVWFLFSPDTHLPNICSFSFENDNEKIIVKFFDCAKNEQNTLCLIKDKDYRIIDNVITITKRRGWFIFNSMASTGVSINTLQIEKDIMGNLIVNKEYLFYGFGYLVVPTVIKENQWNIFQKEQD